MYELQQHEQVVPAPATPAVNMKFRQTVYALEEYIKQLPGALTGNCFPLKHKFAEGLYIRELTIPKGYFCVGKLHKDSYTSFIVSGCMTVLTEEGIKLVTGPSYIVSPPETKRFGYCHEDTVWVTVHPNPTNSMDIEFLESQIHVDDYESLPNPVIDVTPLFTEFSTYTACIDHRFDIKLFRELTKTIYDHEKPGFWSDWSKEQQEIYMSGDWEAFSRSRGYTEEEISDLRFWIQMYEYGLGKGFNPLLLVQDLVYECVQKNLALDTRGEILKSSHMPSSKKIPYREVQLCQG